jgi:ABC-type uncharacterized transport system permease subunit
VIEIVLDIVTSAAILYAVAAGLLIVFGVMKIINFAHGGFLTVGGYAALAVTKLGWNPWMSLVFATATGFVCGMIIERLVVKPLYSRPLDAILATWGLGIIIGQVITIAFGREVQFVQSPMSGAMDFLGASYSSYRLALVLAALAIGGSLAALLQGTRLGLVTQAVIMNEDLARGTEREREEANQPCRGAHHALVERRSEHGGPVARQRVHAGAGLGRFIPEPLCRDRSVRRGAGPREHVREPCPGRPYDRGAGSRAVAHPPARVLA